MLTSGPQRQLARLEDELRHERGAALVRIASTLEGLIARLGHTRAAFEAAGSAEERAALAEVFRQTRKEALLYRWYLEVQREAIGLTRHAVLDEVFRVPDPLA